MTVTTQRPDSEVARARVEWATVPRVNLLPPEIIEGRRFRRLQYRLAAGVVAVLVAGAVGTVWAQVRVGEAESQKQQVQARTAELQQQAAEYAEVPKVLAQVDAVTTARETAMSTDVLWYRFLDELALATPSKVSLASLDLTMTSGPSTATGADPLADMSLGEVVITGNTTSMPEVASWLVSVGSVHGLDVSRLQTASMVESKADAAVNFTAAVGITQQALSHRYDRKVD